MCVNIKNKLRTFIIISITLLVVLMVAVYFASKMSSDIDLNSNIDSKLITKVALNVLKDNKVILEEQELNSMLNYFTKFNGLDKYINAVSIRNKGEDLVLYLWFNYLGKSWVMSSRVNLYFDKTQDKIGIRFFKFKIGDMIIPKVVGITMLKRIFLNNLDIKDDMFFISSKKDFNINGKNINLKITDFKAIDKKYYLNFDVNFNIFDILLNN